MSDMIATLLTRAKIPAGASLKDPALLAKVLIAGEQLLSQRAKRSSDRFCDGPGEEVALWLAKTGKAAALPALHCWREDNLAWRRGTLLSLAAKLGSDALPLLAWHLTPAALADTSPIISRDEFATDICRELFRRGADRKLLASVTKAAAKDRELKTAIAQVIARGGRKPPTLAEVSSPKAMARSDWAEQVRDHLDLGRSDWVDKRKRLKSAVKLLATPAAITNQAWPALVHLVADQTVDFRELSRETYGKAVKPEDDEGGLIETYSDENMSTLDLVCNVLGQPKALASRQWGTVATKSISACLKRQAGIQLGDADLRRLLGKSAVKGKPEYAALLKQMRSAFPYAD